MHHFPATFDSTQCAVKFLSDYDTRLGSYSVLNLVSGSHRQTTLWWHFYQCKVCVDGKGSKPVMSEEQLLERERAIHGDNAPHIANQRDRGDTVLDVVLLASTSFCLKNLVCNACSDSQMIEERFWACSMSQKGWCS